VGSLVNSCAAALGGTSCAAGKLVLGNGIAAESRDSGDSATGKPAASREV
jgi:hypothetical protein